MTALDQVREAICDALKIIPERVFPATELRALELAPNNATFWAVVAKLAPNCPTSVAAAWRTVADVVAYLDATDL